MNPKSQLSLIEYRTDRGIDQPKTLFGGSLLTSHPKIRRPLRTNLPVHVVLRSAFSTLKLPKNSGKIQKQLFKSAKKYGIKIYSFANVGNHLHILIKLSKLRFWSPFIRELTSLIAQIARPNHGNNHRNKDQNQKISSLKFWKHRPFTRIVDGWRKPFQVIKNYIYLNKIEAQGHISRRDVKTLQDFRKLILDG